MDDVFADAIRQTSKQPILETAVYRRDDAIAVTGFSLSTLIRAEDAGKLRGRYQGRRRFYFGRDLLAWLADDGNCEICGDTLANSISPTTTPTGTRCTTCANYRK